jgi:hypothetical protein
MNSLVLCKCNKIVRLLLRVLVICIICQKLISLILVQKLPVYNFLVPWDRFELAFVATWKYGDRRIVGLSGCSILHHIFNDLDNFQDTTCNTTEVYHTVTSCIQVHVACIPTVYTYLQCYSLLVLAD